jgi:hypothetical protein
MIVSSVYAQSNYRSGYIIANNSDTIYGLIDYRSENRNMKVCGFKNSETGKEVEFLPGSIKGYRFSDGKFYVSKYIFNTHVQDTVFVEYLLKGIKNLYYYSKLNYEAYFVENENGELVEMRNDEVTIIKDNVEYRRKDKRYIGMLNVAFSDCPEILSEIPNARYTHKSLITISKKYHDYMCDDEECVIYEKSMPLFVVELRPSIGYQSSSYNFGFENSRRENVDVSISPNIGLGFNIFVPRFNEKLSVLIDLQMNKDEFNQHYLLDEFPRDNYFFYRIEQVVLNSNLALKYKYPKGHLRPTAFAGLSFRNHLKSDHLYYIGKIDNNPSQNAFKEFNREESVGMGFIGGLGVEYVLFNKYKMFSNLSVQHNSDFSTAIESVDFSSRFPLMFQKVDMLSFRFSTGFVF